MSNRNSNTKFDSNSNKFDSSRKSTSTSTSTPSLTFPATTQTTRRARKPMTIRVRSTGEEISRVPIQRSGYAVVRYGGYYHTVRGGGRTAPYIVGVENGDDVLGRA